MAERIRGPRAIVGIRRRAVEVHTGAWERQYRAYFNGLSRRYMASHPGGKSWEPVFHVKQSGFWGQEASILRGLLNQQYADMTQTVWTDVVGAQVGRALDFDLNARGVRSVLSNVATRVTQINGASQEMIAQRVASEIERGSNPDVLERSVRDLLQGWGESGSRAHVIALTESGNAYNLAATNGYRESGLVEMVQVYDGPDCGWTEHDDPDLADGSTRTLEEADLYPLSHPHCQRAFGPVVLTEGEAQAAGIEAGDAAVQEEDALQVDDSGLSQDLPEPTLSRDEQIQVQGERIRDIPDHEVGIAVDQDGRVIVDKLGSGPRGNYAGSVDFTEQELQAMRGQTLIHNHPGAYQEGWERSGAFSPQDLLLAHEYQIGEMRVVGKGVDYIARVPTNIPRGTLQRIIERADSRVRSETYDWIAAQKAEARAAASVGGHFDMIAYGRAEKAIYSAASQDHWHKAWEYVSRDVPGFHYERILHGRG